jgi:hypothetical protein
MVVGGFPKIRAREVRFVKLAPLKVGAFEVAIGQIGCAEIHLPTGFQLELEHRKT